VSIRSSSGSTSWTEDPGVPDTVAVLVNVIWIVEHLDGAGLAEIGDVPILELAKHISIGRRAA
jgi:hypothetical protein